ncbi:unnamed protein product, partial [Phaeothamnion confervicola]
QWAEKAARLLQTPLPAMLMCCCHSPSWRVRRAAVAAAGAVLLRCTAALHSCRLGLLEVLAAALWDGMPSVAEAAAAALRTVWAAAGPCNWLEDRAGMLKRALQLADALPAEARSANEARLRGNLDLLSGFCFLIGGGASRIGGGGGGSDGGGRSGGDGGDGGGGGGTDGGSRGCSDNTSGGGKDDDGGGNSDNSSGSSGVAGIRGGDSALIDATLPQMLRGLAEVFHFDVAALGARVVESAGDALAAGRPSPAPFASGAPSGTLSAAVGASAVPVAPAKAGRAKAAHAAVTALYHRRPLAHVREEATLTAARRAVRLLGRLSDPWSAADCILSRLTAGDTTSRDAGAGLPSRRSAPLTLREHAMRVEARLPLAALLCELAMSWGNDGGSEGDASAVGGTSGDGDGNADSGSSGGGGKSGADGVARLVARRIEPTPDVAEAVALRLLQSGAWAAQSAAPSLAMTSASARDATAALAAELCQVLGALFVSFGPSADRLLLHAIYPLLERAVDSHPVVRRAALSTLSLAASRLGYGGLQALLAANMDYIVDAATRRLADCCSGGGGGGGWGSVGGGRHDLAACVVAVAEAVLAHSGAAAAAPLVRDLCEAVLRLADSLWWDDGAAVSAGIRVMRAMVRCLQMPKLRATPDAAEANTGGAAYKATSATEVKSPSPPLPPSSGVVDSTWYQQLFFDFARPGDAAPPGAAPSDGFDLGNDEPGGTAAATAITPATMAEKWQGVHRERDARNAAGRFEDARAEAVARWKEEEKRRIAESPEVKIVQAVLLRVGYLLAAPCLAAQAAAAAAARECLGQLAAVGAAPMLLPAVHALWPALMAQFRLYAFEQPAGGSNGSQSNLDSGSGQSFEARRAVLLHLLETVASIAERCGDFLSIKVAEELWPALRVLFVRYGPRAAAAGGPVVGVGSAGGGAKLAIGGRRGGVAALTGGAVDGDVGSSGGGGGGGGGGSDRRWDAPSELGGSGIAGRNRMDARIAESVLRCLSAIVAVEGCRRFMTPLAAEAAALALRAMSDAAPAGVAAAAEELFRGLMLVDGDSVWLLLAQ